MDQQNRVLISTDPARGAVSWRLAPGGPGRHLDNVQQLSCPSSHLCVGLAGHYVVSSVAPQRGGTAWSLLLVNPDAPAFTVDCAATTQCVATNPDGQLLTSSDPTGRTAWKLVRLDRSARRLWSASLSCASATQCVAAFGDGRVFSTNNLTASTPTWDQTQLGSSHLPDRPVTLNVSCTAGNVCAAVAGGSVWASAAPGRSGQRRWRHVAIDAGTAAAGDVLTSVACVAGQLCVAVDRAGHVLSSRTITQRGSWRRQTIADPNRNGQRFLRTATASAEGGPRCTGGSACGCSERRTARLPTASHWPRTLTGRRWGLGRPGLWPGGGSAQCRVRCPLTPEVFQDKHAH